MIRTGRRSEHVVPSNRGPFDGELFPEELKNNDLNDGPTQGPTITNQSTLPMNDHTSFHFGYALTDVSHDSTHDPMSDLFQLPIHDSIHEQIHDCSTLARSQPLDLLLRPSPRSQTHILPHSLRAQLQLVLLVMRLEARLYDAAHTCSFCSNDGGARIGHGSC